MVSAAGFEPAISDFQGRRERPNFPTRCKHKTHRRLADGRSSGSWKAVSHNDLCRFIRSKSKWPVDREGT